MLVVDVDVEDVDVEEVDVDVEEVEVDVEDVEEVDVEDVDVVAGSVTSGHCSAVGARLPSQQGTPSGPPRHPANARTHDTTMKQRGKEGCMT